MAKRSKFTTGDRVRYAGAFLRNTGQFTGWAPFARGTVLSTAAFGGSELVRVRWDDVAEPKGILDCNLERHPS